MEMTYWAMWSGDDLTYLNTLHELGHNIVGEIEPAVDKFVDPVAGTDDYHSSQADRQLYPTFSLWQRDYMDSRWASDMYDVGEGLRRPDADLWTSSAGLGLDHIDYGPRDLNERLQVLDEIENYPLGEHP